MSGGPGNSDWLVRPGTIRLLWRIFVGILIITLLAQLVFDVKGYFGADGWFGFGALFGFGACLVLVILAKGLGVLLKRNEHYYDESDPDV